MKYVIILFALFATSFIFTQDKEWILQQEYTIQEIDCWDVDPMGKLIYANEDVLIKLDSNFQVLFRQSLKEFGNISDIDARHALKTLIFSENQQTIAFLDNTLTYHQSVKDLSISNVSYATKASYSAQSTRYWLYDVDNTKLIMFDEVRNQPSVIENLAGILGTLSVDVVREMENYLLILDKTKGIYVFDYYGSMIDFIETDAALNVAINKGYLYYLTKENLVRFDLRARDELRLNLPSEGVIDFRILGNYIFLQSADGIKKYLLK
jgi:hypothetical protein